MSYKSFLHNFLIFIDIFFNIKMSLTNIIPVHQIYQAHKKTKDVVAHTKLMKSNFLSSKY